MSPDRRAGLLRRLMAFYLLLVIPAAAAEWRLQYFYDEDRSTLTITDLQFPSAQRGMALGYTTQKDKTKPVAVVTSDGGLHWSVVPLKDRGLTMFFLDDSLGWMVAPKNLWVTQEAGRSWSKVGKLPPDVMRVYFLDREHGFAAGGQKSVYETKNGGKKWVVVPASQIPKANPKYTGYTWIEFVKGRIGMVTGFSRPPRRSDTELPDWLEPEKAQRRREWPSVSISLDTHDGGANWTASAASMFGQITRVRLRSDGIGLGLISYYENFQWPSEVLRLDWTTGKSASVYREKDRVITDVAVPEKGPAYLAGYELVGKLRLNPVPGKLRILKSEDLTRWVDMDVDYRATANRAMLAAADGQNIWVATDNGMILKLVP